MKYNAIILEYWNTFCLKRSWSFPKQIPAFLPTTVLFIASEYLVIMLSYPSGYLVFISME